MPHLEADNAAPERTLRVLLVDDDDDLRATLSAGLRSRGLTVTAASGAAEAHAAFADPSIEMDVVVMDLMLPGSWGPQVAMERTVYRPEVPVLYISGYSMEDTVLLATASGSDIPFLQKPFGVGDLVEAIQRVAGDARQGS